MFGQNKELGKCDDWDKQKAEHHPFLHEYTGNQNDKKEEWLPETDHSDAVLNVEETKQGVNSVVKTFHWDRLVVNKRGFAVTGH